jgi:hypothetical protein
MFTVRRSALEKTYCEELLKLSSSFLKDKKIPNIPDIKIEGGEEKWNMWNVWRTVLEENEKLARARLAAVEVFQQQIVDDAKILRSHKIQGAKKVSRDLRGASSFANSNVSSVWISWPSYRRNSKRAFRTWTKRKSCTSTRNTAPTVLGTRPGTTKKSEFVPRFFLAASWTSVWDWMLEMNR